MLVYQRVYIYISFLPMEFQVWPACGHSPPPPGDDGLAHGDHGGLASAGASPLRTGTRPSVEKTREQI